MEIERKIIETKPTYRKCLEYFNEYWEVADNKEKEELLSLYSDISGKSMKQIYQELNDKSVIPKTSEELEKIDRRIFNESKNVVLIVLERNCLWKII